MGEKFDKNFSNFLKMLTYVAENIKFNDPNVWIRRPNQDSLRMNPVKEPVSHSIFPT